MLKQDVNIVEFLMNAADKHDKNFKPNWQRGKIVEENERRYLIQTKEGGIYNRLKEDVRR